MLMSLALTVGPICAKTLELKIPKMTCESCAAEITKALEKLGPISKTKADAAKQIFSFDISDSDIVAKKFDDASIKAIVEKVAGYQVSEITRKP